MSNFKKLIYYAPLQPSCDLPNSKLKQVQYPVVYSNGIKNCHSEFKSFGPGVITGRSGTIGKVTRKQAEEKTLAEYEKFNKLQKIESDFDKQVKALEKQHKKQISSGGEDE